MLRLLMKNIFYRNVYLSIVTLRVLLRNQLHLYYMLERERD